MQVNKFVTMAVGLIVGVLLISGVVAPVIANVSSNGDGGGSGVETDITGFDRYAKVTDSTDVTIYPYFDKDAHQYGYSYTDPSEPDAQIHMLHGREGWVVGDGWMMYLSAMSDASGMIAFWGLSWEGADYFIYELHLTGNSTVATGNIAYTSTQVTLDLPASLYYPSPDGQFVSPVSVDRDAGQYTYLPFYANSNSEVFCEITCEDDSDTYWYMYAVGTISDNTAWIDSGDVESFSDSVAFTIEDGIVTGATVTVDGSTYDVTLPSEWEEDGENSTIPAGYGSIYLLPVSVYEGGGSDGGSGLSPTLTTILSVIPLILTVGLVIGAIGYLRFKE